MAKIEIQKMDLEEARKLGIDSWSSWECEPSTFDWSYPAAETAYVFEGDVVVMTLKQDDGGLPCGVVTVTEKDGHVDLNEVMTWLAKQQVNEVHVEAGATLTGALLADRLVDEIVVYVAPHIMGHDARGLFNMPELVTMDDRVALEIKDLRQVGKDIRITAIPLYN